MQILNAKMQNYIENTEVPGSIAKNQALTENIFSIVVCVENNIPLIITGPPGNSIHFHHTRSIVIGFVVELIKI
ncbi:MAG TPA: hypothetical protein VIL29_00120 [Pseudothermotoga sp.]